MAFSHSISNPNPKPNSDRSAAAPTRSPPASAMASSQTLWGTSRAGRFPTLTLGKIFKNAAWQKHSNLVSACNAALDRLDAVTDSNNSPSSPLRGLYASNADTFLHPLALAFAFDTASTKVPVSALDCAQKLFFRGLMVLIRGKIDY